MPKSVTICELAFQTTIYIPPVAQCLNCLLFGHTKSQRKSNSRCHSCAEYHEPNANDECNKVYCMHCGTNEHKSTSKLCVGYERQKESLVQMINFLCLLYSFHIWELASSFPLSLSFSPFPMMVLGYDKKVEWR